jgi:TolB-like protein/class 3 adenylate cyclase/Flp pilus assembly protein TadD
MTEERAKRKLSGILNADAVGYSRLMQEEEASTIRNLEDSKRLMSELIEQFKGRVVDAPGDNLLAEFGSVVDATECAVKIQQELKTKNADLPDNRRMDFRIGVNLGDVVEEAERIYGDGVNIAARIEGLAEPGGICISGTAFDQVKNKLKLGYEYLGEHSVKNIAEPVRVYKVLMEPEYAGKVIGEEKPKPTRWRWAALVSAVIVAFGAIAVWNFYFRTPTIEPASVDRMAFPLPDKPSIAVLPFDNLSGDSEQEYFSDGITNDIITDLSKFRDLFVVASNSTFTYKNKPTKVQEVSRDLGVRYVLEGGVQKSGDRVRINAQLIDATTGEHLWAERFDRRIDDIFAVQDEITEKIVAAVYIKADLAARDRAMRKSTENVEAYDLILRARELFRRWGKENNDEALRLQEKAIELDPEYATAYKDLAWTLVHGYLYYGGPKESLDRAFEVAQKAVSLDYEDYRNHWGLGMVRLQKRLFDQAIAAYEKALALNPNDADFVAEMADALTHVGRPQDAIEQMKQAMRLNPITPNWYAWNLGWAYYHAGQYEEAIVELKPLLPLGWSSVPRRLAASYAQLGYLDEARAQVAEILKIDPDFSIATFAKTQAYKNPTDLEHYLDGLRKAGLPD